MTGHVSKPGGLLAPDQHGRDEARRPWSPVRPLDTLREEPGRHATDEDASCELAATGGDGDRSGERCGGDVPQLHDDPSRPFEPVRQPVDPVKRRNFPLGHPIMFHPPTEEEQTGESECRPHAGVEARAGS
jgi:hypothetical protein